jgi:UDPglucose 6-dehydrogenase
MAAYAGCHPQQLRAVMEINRDQGVAVAAKVRAGLGGTLDGAVIALLGLAFKPNTDDMREAPSVDLAEQFLAAGARVAAYDPQATARAVLGARITYQASAYAAVEGADTVVLVTDWPEFQALDLERVKTLMRGDIFVDGRNLYGPEVLRALGFRYYGMGRGYAAQPFPADAEDLYQDANGGA